MRSAEMTAPQAQPRVSSDGQGVCPLAVPKWRGGQVAKGGGRATRSERTRKKPRILVFFDEVAKWRKVASVNHSIKPTPRHHSGGVAKPYIRGRHFATRFRLRFSDCAPGASVASARRRRFARVAQPLRTRNDLALTPTARSIVAAYRGTFFERRLP